MNDAHGFVFATLSTIPYDGALWLPPASKESATRATEDGVRKMKSEKQDMRELTVGEKALRQTVLRGAAWNVRWAFLIGGAATAAIFMFTSGWVKWALFIPVMLWVFGCIKKAMRDVSWLLAQEASRESTDHASSDMHA